MALSYNLSFETVNSTFIFKSLQRGEKPMKFFLTLKSSWNGKTNNLGWKLYIWLLSLYLPYGGYQNFDFHYLSIKWNKRSYVYTHVPIHFWIYVGAQGEYKMEYVETEISKVTWNNIKHISLNFYSSSWSDFKKNIFRTNFRVAIKNIY